MIHTNLLPKGSLHAEQFTYRTQCGKRYFTCSFHETSRGYEIDILKNPSFEGRSEISTTIHQVTSPRGGRMICFEFGQNPQTLQEAKDIACAFFELTSDYIETGNTFE